MLSRFLQRRVHHVTFIRGSPTLLAPKPAAVSNSLATVASAQPLALMTAVENVGSADISTESLFYFMSVTTVTSVRLIECAGSPLLGSARYLHISLVPVSIRDADEMLLTLQCHLGLSHARLSFLRGVEDSLRKRRQRGSVF